MMLAESGYYIRTYDRDIFVTKDQKSKVEQAIDNSSKYFKINDSLVMISQIKEIIPSSEYMKSPKGGYYCPNHKDNFVPKGKTCGYCNGGYYG